MIDVLDRVPRHPGRIKLTYPDGTVKYAVMERADEPVEVGTPINKALFDSIKSGNDLVQLYNVPQILKMWDDYNYLALDNKITEYEVGMRILIEPEQQYTDFDSSILPKLTADDTPVKGFSANVYKAYDKDDTTNNGTNMSAVITCPVPIKPSSIYYSVGGYYPFTILGEETELAKVSVSASANNKTGTLEISDDNYYTEFTIKSTSGYQRYNTLDVISGSVGMLNKELYSYININNLGDKLISSKIECGKKYELVYDGTLFNASEVV